MNLFSMYEHEKGFSFVEEMSAEMGFDFSLFSSFLVERVEEEKVKLSMNNDEMKR